MPSRRTWAISAAAALTAFVLLGIAVTQFETVPGLDRDLERFVANHTASGTREFALDWLSAPGNFWIVLIGMLIGVGLLAQNRRLRDATLLSVAVGGQAFLVPKLKMWFAVARPGPLPTDFGFPSGHATSATVLFGVAALMLSTQRPRAWPWVAAAAIIMSTGLGRVLGDVHWLSDVLGGLLLGTAFVAAVALSRGPANSAVAKPAAEGGSLIPVEPAAAAMRVIGFTGMPGSGKSEAMEVAKARQFPVVRMGDLIWEEVERQGLPRDAANVGRVANAMREAHGKDIWSRRSVERVKSVAGGAKLVLIDGIRNIEEVETFRRELGHDFVLVAIHTDPDHRFQRMVQRARADDSTDTNVLKARDEREMGWGIARTIALADEMLVNDTTLANFRLKVAALLDRLAVK